MIVGKRPNRLQTRIPAQPGRCAQDRQEEYQSISGHAQIARSYFAPLGVQYVIPRRNYSTVLQRASVSKVLGERAGVSAGMEKWRRDGRAAILPPVI
jgi:hypothetical protein